MATFPSLQSILLEIHQSLGCPTKYQTKEKRKFAAREQHHDYHARMMMDIIDEICDALVSEEHEEHERNSIRESPSKREAIKAMASLSRPASRYGCCRAI